MLENRYARTASSLCKTDFPAMVETTTRRCCPGELPFLSRDMAPPLSFEPPSTRRMSPVIQRASVDARAATASATSSGCAMPGLPFRHGGRGAERREQLGLLLLMAGLAARLSLVRNPLCQLPRCLRRVGMARLRVDERVTRDALRPGGKLFIDTRKLRMHRDEQIARQSIDRRDVCLNAGIKLAWDASPVNRNPSSDTGFRLSA